MEQNKVKMIRDENDYCDMTKTTIIDVKLIIIMLMKTTMKAIPLFFHSILF